MKKSIFVLLIAAVLLLSSCAGGSNGQTNANSLAFEDQIFNIDAVNYDMGEISGATKLGDSGVRYAFAVNIAGANSYIGALNKSLSTGLVKYDESEKGSIVIMIVTLGEGESSKYRVESVEKGDSIDLVVNLVTEGGDPSDRANGQYHFIKVEVPICGKVTVNLDGVKVGG